MVITTSPRLTIERLSHSDFRFIEVLVNEPAFIKYIGDKGVSDKLTAIRYLDQGPLASYDKFDIGLYKVSRSSDGLPIGLCGLLQRDIFVHPDLGFAFLAEHGGKGFGFEAATAVMAYEVKRKGFKTVCAITAQDNQPSMALLKKLGFSQVIGDAKPDCGEFEPANYFELKA